MGSKNNPQNRGKVEQKTYDGKPVKPVLYIGSHTGHGKYMAVQFDNGDMPTDESGKPVMWDAL